MADLDLDELERLSQARPTDGPAVLEYLAALYLSAPALIAAARERDRLRALCREAADALRAIDSALECECVCDCASDEQEHEPECQRCAACTVDNVLPARLRARLRAAGGGT